MILCPLIGTRHLCYIIRCRRICLFLTFIGLLSHAILNHGLILISIPPPANTLVRWVDENFTSIVQADLPHLWPTGLSRIAPRLFGISPQPFRFHLTVDTLSSGCLATECKLRNPLGCLLRFRPCARLGFSLFAIPGQRGVTPAFGYSTPHPGARGTLTLLISSLPSAHYRLLRPCAPHRYSHSCGLQYKRNTSI